MSSTMADSRRDYERIQILGELPGNATVQQTLYAMAEVILATYAEISVVTLTLQERPYRPVDLLDMERNDLFVARDEPIGIVEVTVERS